MRVSRFEQMRQKLVDDKIILIDDSDILIVAAWNHQQNIESSDKLLLALLRHHGEDKC
jgi:hypothetical protein